MATADDPDEPNLEERTIARLERRVLELEKRVGDLQSESATRLATIDRLRTLLAPLGKFAVWLEDKQDNVYIAQSLRGVDPDGGPTVADCRAAAVELGLPTSLPLT